MSDIYTKTHSAVIALSALGLLHAGHGVPEDLVRPFVAAFMSNIKEYCPDQSLHDGLWWTLDLIGRIFIRTLAEGSTPVIIAINRNTSKAMKTAVANYPRGQREVVLLTVQVGTESMSPLTLGFYQRQAVLIFFAPACRPSQQSIYLFPMRCRT